MKAFIIIFIFLFSVTALWRVVFTKKRERNQIRSFAREAVIAFAVASTGAIALFFALFNNTVRVI
jgi:hypothetical protein